MPDRSGDAAPILVLNAGSSSLKYQVLVPETAEVLAKGLVERIGEGGDAGVPGLAEDRVQPLGREMVEDQVDDAPRVEGLGLCCRIGRHAHLHARRRT